MIFFMLLSKLFFIYNDEKDFGMLNFYWIDR